MRALTAYLNATSNAMTWVDSTGTVKRPGFTLYRREWLDLTVNVTRAGVALALPADYTYQIAGKDGRTLVDDPPALIDASSGLWAIGTEFAERAIVYHGAQGYRVLKGQGHTATADDEPGIGVNAEDYWEEVAHDPPAGILQFSVNCNTAALLAYLQAGGTLATITDGAPRGRGRMIGVEIVGLDADNDEVATYGQGPVAAVLDIITGNEIAPLFNPSLLHVRATTDPTVDDDSADGFSTWSTWANTSTGILHVCTDASAGAAVWETFATLEDLQAILAAYLASVAATELTLNAGSVTPTTQHHTLDSEGDAASDDLVTILTWIGFLMVSLEDAARVITMKHGTSANQIACPGGTDVQMQANAAYLLHRAAATDPWRIVGGTGGGALNIGGLTDGTSAQADDLFVVERSGSNRKIKIDPMGEAEAETGTATTPRLIDAATLKAAVIEHAPGGSGSVVKVAAYSGPNHNITVASAYRTVNLTVELSDPDNIAAVSSNQIQIAAAGTYRMRVWMDGLPSQPFNVEARIRDVTNSADLAYVSRYMSSGYGPTGLNMETPLFVLAGAANIEVQVFLQSDTLEIGSTTYDPTSRGSYVATRVILEKVA